MSERIEHAVVGMNGGDVVLSQLVVRDLNQRFHPVLVIGPIADELHAMRQIAVGVGEIGFELQRLGVVSDGFVDVARVFVDGGQVGISVGKSRIDLNRSQVTIDGALQIAHLLQRVAHVRIRIGEGGVDSRERGKTGDGVE